MCRIFIAYSPEEKDFTPILKKFAHGCKFSKEYQGHGFGVAFLNNGQWNIFKSIDPIWQGYLGEIPKTHLLMAHARSAFEDKDINVNNNMPFSDGYYTFIFNGELRSVKIKSQGRIGAEKIFNFIKRFIKNNDIQSAMQKSNQIIIQRSKKIKAMNYAIATPCQLLVNCYYTEDKDYFTLYKTKEKNYMLISSFPFLQYNWVPFNKGEILRIKLQ